MTDRILRGGAPLHRAVSRMVDHEAHVTRIVALFEGLKREDAARLAEAYTPDARFKDPFNEVQGLAAIRRIFEHMYATLDGPHFVIHERVLQGPHCFLTWDFVFAMKSGGRGTVPFD